MLTAFIIICTALHTLLALHIVAHSLVPALDEFTVQDSYAYRANLDWSQLACQHVFDMLEEIRVPRGNPLNPRENMHTLLQIVALAEIPTRDPPLVARQKANHYATVLPNESKTLHIGHLRFKGSE